MKKILFVILTLVTVNAVANTNEFSHKIARFCKLRKGLPVKADFECAGLPYRIMRHFNLKPYRKTVIDSTNTQHHLVEVGDYVYYNKFVGKWGKISSHFAVVIGIKGDQWLMADQNVDGENFVHIEDGNMPMVIQGHIEVYSYKKGRWNYDKAGAMRPKN
jgi:hypothetical protein